MKKAVISPESLYALCDTPTPKKETVREPQEQPKVKVPLRTRVIGFFKKVISVVKPALAVISVFTTLLLLGQRYELDIYR